MQTLIDSEIEICFKLLDLSVRIDFSIILTNFTNNCFLKIMNIINFYPNYCPRF